MHIYMHIWHLYAYMASIQASIYAQLEILESLPLSCLVSKRLYLRTTWIHHVVCLHFLLSTSCYLISLVGSDPRIHRGARDYRIQVVIILVFFRQLYFLNFMVMASLSCLEVSIVQQESHSSGCCNLSTSLPQCSLYFIDTVCVVGIHIWIGHTKPSYFCFDQLWIFILTLICRKRCFFGEGTELNLLGGMRISTQNEVKNHIGLGMWQNFFLIQSP